MRKLLFFVLFAGLVLLLKSGVSVVNSEELSTLKGTEFKVGHALQANRCGHDNAPGSGSGCVKTQHNLNMPPYTSYYTCDGGCADWCVSTVWKRYCACSLASSCDTSLEVSCTGGTLYKSNVRCVLPLLGGDCPDCQYYQTGDGC